MRLLTMGWSEGLEVFLYDGKLNAYRADGPLTDGDKRFIQRYKNDLVFEIKDLTYGPRVNFDSFIEDREGTRRQRE